VQRCYHICLPYTFTTPVTILVTIAVTIAILVTLTDHFTLQEMAVNTQSGESFQRRRGDLRNRPPAEEVQRLPFTRRGYSVGGWTSL